MGAMPRSPSALSLWYWVSDSKHLLLRLSGAQAPTAPNTYAGAKGHDAMKASNIIRANRKRKREEAETAKEAKKAAREQKRQQREDMQVANFDRRAVKALRCLVEENSGDFSAICRCMCVAHVWAFTCTGV